MKSRLVRKADPREAIITRRKTMKVNGKHIMTSEQEMYYLANGFEWFLLEEYYNLKAESNTSGYWLLKKRR